MVLQIWNAVNKPKVHSEKKKVSVVSEEVDRLQREISFVEAEVDVWMKELAEVNDARTNLDVI